VVESLETNQLELQTIIGMGKFVDYFRDRVLRWQRTLGDVEETIAEWVKVCKSWAALESIFLASADIRAQLPDDTKRSRASTPSSRSSCSTLRRARG
jgi:dynein heavy chain